MNGKAISTVGLVGAGRMGMPIVAHLVKNGFQVLVRDADDAKRAKVELVGATWVDDVTSMCNAGAVLVCVGYDHEVRALMHGDRGLFRHVADGAIVTILSTILPTTVQDLARAGAPRVHVVDSTVCRGGWAADEGTLLSFVGGDAQVVERLRPVLAAYSTDIVHTGGVGTAQVAKAANNLILWACLVADHEALALAHRFGVDVEALRQALLISSATNGALSNWGRQTMAWAQDDMAIVAEMADACGISLPQAGVVREICRTLKSRRYDLDRYGN
jgi:3-hydroxyisobutyrate dehydrogenase